MAKRAYTLGTIGCLLISSPAYAGVQVEFLEGAPKDRFILTNLGSCDIGSGQFVIDFAASKAGLIFDITGSGAGVEVFQPFEITAGAQHLASQPVISDGDQRAILDITDLDHNKSIAFTIDVDDTNGTREITVSDQEIQGTIVSFETANTTYSAVFEANAQVVLNIPACNS